MKNDNLIFCIGAVLVIGGAIMKIMHLPGAEIADPIYKFTLECSSTSAYSTLN